MGSSDLERLVRGARRGLGAVLALACACFSAACAAAPVTVWVAGTQVQGAPAASVAGGVVWGPLAACAKAAGASVDWDAGPGTLVLSRADLGKLVLTVGSAQGRAGAATVALGGKMAVRQGQAYGPLEPVLGWLGLRSKWDAQARRFTATGVVRSVTVRAGERGARISVSCSIPCRTLPGTVGSPPKRYVDVLGCLAGTGLPATRFIYTGDVLRVRAGQPPGKVATRVVADLAQALPMRWEPAPGGLGGDLVVGTASDRLPVVTRNLPRLTGVTVVQRPDGEERLRVSSDWPLQVRWSLVSKPPRIVLEASEIESGLGESDLPMAGEFVSWVRVAPGQGAGLKLEVGLRDLMRFSVEQSGKQAEVVFRRGRLQDQTVALDPGHGGNDSGARGRVLLEKDVNLDVALRAARRLQEAGARYMLTRSKDETLGLYQRPDLALIQHADVFVSIHCNAMPRRNQGHGTETWYHRPDSVALAMLLQNALAGNLGRTDRGVKTARFVVVREAQMPAALVELMFINDDQEEALLQQENTRESAAAAIVEGVRQFIEGRHSRSFAAGTDG